MGRFSRLSWLAASILVIAVCSTGLPTAAATDWVLVEGDPDNPNPPDATSTGFYGSVGYSYAIGKYEVTQAEYVEFLNAVARDSDPNRLYRAIPYPSHGLGIVRDPVSGEYSLLPPVPDSQTPFPGEYDYAKKPVNFVTFMDALRYANWLHNGKPVGPQGIGTTETGAYTLVGGWNGTRNADARYWIPSEDEWYKAAHYDPITGTYSRYPTGSSTPPSSVLPAFDNGNAANFRDASGQIPNIDGGLYPLTDVGAYALSDSPYGTYDQGGNLYEFTDSLYSSSTAVMRGGSWYTNVGNVDSWARQSTIISSIDGAEDSIRGFRIAGLPSVIPEPGTGALLAVAGCALLLTLSRRRRRR